MHENLLLENVITGVLNEILKLGLCQELNCQYRRVYDRLREFSGELKQDSYSSILVDKFLIYIEQRSINGLIGKARRNHLRRSALLLREYAENGKIEWKTYGSKINQMPLSFEFLVLYSTFLDNLTLCGKSGNTIQSARNIIRQFLLFLEDSNCSSISTAYPDMIPAFFKHMHSTYRPTSIRTVASNIRSFLSFVDGGECLLHAVPSRCVRGKPIIPILSDEEHDALKKILKTQMVTLRDKAIIMLSLRTGLRAADIVQMKLSDIDWVNDTISIIQSKTKNPLMIPLTADVGNLLSAYILDERPKTDNPVVFLRSSAPWRQLSGHSACYALVRKAFRQAGIRKGSERKGIHVLRHSVASRLLTEGVPVTIITSLLGHMNKSSTDVYLSTDETRMRECALGIANIPKCAVLA